MSKAFSAPFYFFAGPSKLMLVTIPDGHRLVVFSMGKSPSVVPPELMPMGDYEMAPEPLPGGSYPIGMQVLPAGQASLVEKISASTSDEIMRKAALEQEA